MLPADQPDPTRPDHTEAALWQEDIIADTVPLKLHSVVTGDVPEGLKGTGASTTERDRIALGVGLPLSMAMEAPPDREELCPPGDGRRLTACQTALRELRATSSPIEVSQEISALLDGPSEIAHQLVHPLLDVEEDAARSFLTEIAMTAQEARDDPSGLLGALIPSMHRGLLTCERLGIDPLPEGGPRPHLAAIDLARAIHLARLAATLELLSMEEAWILIRAAGREAAALYPTWRAFAEAYLVGSTIEHAARLEQADAIAAARRADGAVMLELFAQPLSRWVRSPLRPAVRSRRTYGDSLKF